MRKRRAPKISELMSFYRGLSPRARRTVWVVLVLEAMAVAVAERDIQRRPAEGVRGPKLLWRAIATQNIIGPAAYLALGRRPPG
jgi:hypothetical protein